MDIPAALSRNRLTVAKRQKIKKTNSKQQTTGLAQLSEVHNLFQMTVEKVVTPTNYNRGANSAMNQSEFVAITSNWLKAHIRCD